LIRDRTRLWPIAAIVITVAPLALLVIVIACHMLDVPYWDQWELVSLLRETRASGLDLHDLWAQHSEHRLVFPQLLMLGLASLTHWNTTCELWVSVLLAAVTLAVFVAQTRRLQTQCRTAATLWHLPAMSVLVFSLSQEQNWLWGWQLQIYLNVLAVVGAIALLGSERRSPWALSGAVALALVATYSFANGMMVWPIGLLVIWLVPAGGRRPQWAHALLWVSAAALAAATYLYGYHKPDYHPAIQSPFNAPMLWGAYVAAYLGAALSGPFGRTASALGAAGLGLAVLAPIVLLRYREVKLSALVPLWAIALYAILSAAVTACGRAGFGVGQALSSRYIPFAHLLWLPIIVQLLVLASLRRDDAPEGGRTRTGPIRALAGLAVLVIVLASARSSLLSIPRWEEHRVLLTAAREKMLDPATQLEGLSAVYPRPQEKLRDLRFLRAHGLSLFRGTEPPAHSAQPGDPERGAQSQRTQWRRAEAAPRSVLSTRLPDLQ